MAINLFDANFYRAANPGIASLDDAQAKSHFENFGLNQGLRFSPLVDLNYYRASNIDLAGLDNRQTYEHLSNTGVVQGRKFSPFFDFGFYRSQYSDLISLNNEQLFEHLRTFGIAEGRQFSPFLNLNFYKNINSSLAGLNNKQALEHLELFGLNEGLRFSPFVDLNIYQLANPDLRFKGLNNKGLLENLVNSGAIEGRRYSVSFDANYYRNQNADLPVGLDNIQLLQHFQNSGLNRGLASSESFSVLYYLAANPDLEVAKFNNQQALENFETLGFQQNRIGAPINSIFALTDRNDNTLDTAFNFGFLSRNRSFSNQFLGANDPNDYYRFALGKTTNLNISLTGLNAKAKLELIYDANGNGKYDTGERLYESFDSQNGNVSIIPTLGAGTYFIRAYPLSDKDNINYNLEISASPAPVTTLKDPGNNYSSAADIGTVNETNRSFTDFVGTVDRSDFYRFNLTQTSDFNLSFTGLSDFIYAEVLYDLNGNGDFDSDEKLYDTYGSRFSNGSIKATLGTGNYFIRVHTFNFSDNSNYTITTSAKSKSATTLTDPGSTFATALDIGVLNRNRTYNNFVGTVDSQDFYRFTLSENRLFSLSFGDLTDDALVEVISDRNANGQYDVGEALYGVFGSQFSSNTLLQNLNAGTYYLRVHTGNLVDNTAYTLAISA
jgi:Bacterial pre-peptidase C-terminal domain